MSWLTKLQRQILPGTTTRRRRIWPRLELECLEDRLAPSAVPVISVSAPLSPFIGTLHAPVSVTFANSSASGATNPGYAPWDYVVLPNVGADGDNGEGVSFDSSGTPNYLGAPVAFQESTVPNTGMVTGPSFALDTNGDPIVLNGLTPNDQVIFLQLPFGSYAVDQPGGTINFAVNVSDEATVGAGLVLTGGGGFAFGNDALNNPTTDPPILASTTTATVTPTLFHVTKTYLGPEQETATGPNFKEQYEIDISVANGQTINNLQVTDALPNNMQFVNLNTATANSGVETSDNAATLTAGPGGTLTVHFNKVLGTGGNVDAKVVFTFYIPELDSSHTQVLPLNTGSFSTSTDNASASGVWTNAFDPSDGNNVSVSQSAAPNTITDKSIAVQKSVSVVGGGPVTQGSVLQYTIHFQVSDYFAFQQLNIGDLLPDGVRFDQTFTPTLAVAQHTDFADNTGSSATTPFNGANYLSPMTGSYNADGTQTLNFAVSAELMEMNRGQSGELIGGNIPSGGTGGGIPPDAFNSPLTGGTTGTIVFQAIVQQQYSVRTSPLGNKDIKQGDSLTNVVPNATGPDVTIQPGGQVLGYQNLAPTSTFQADNSAATVVIATGLIAKSIYAINGNTSVTSPYQMQAGDTITYRLEYLLPTSTAENFVLNDYLPLPVFDSTTLTTFDGTNATNTVAPATGVAEFGPGVTGVQPANVTLPSGTVNYTTIFPNPVNDPTISSAASTNTVSFVFPKDLEDTQQRESLVDVLFSVTVLDRPFGDGLFLTNQANAQEGNTAANLTTANAIQQIELTQPNLNIVKGVVSTNDANGLFTPGTVGPVPFATPGSSGPTFTGTITSPGLTANPVNSDLSNLHAGDLVKFAIVVQNTGMGVNGAFNVEIQDTLPIGFVLPTNPTALNLQVVNGTGTSLAYTNVSVGDTDPLFQNGIKLTDPSSTQGALAAGKDVNGNVVATGKNIAILTYDLQVEPDNTQSDAVSPGEQLTNTASLFHYAATPGGVDYLASPLTDPATVTITQPQNTKSLVTTSEPTSPGSNVVIGEVVRYQLVVQLPASKSPGLEIVDNLPAGLSYLGNAMVGFVSANGSELFSSTLTNAPYYLTGTSPMSPNATATITGTSTGADGAPVTFALGDITNNDDANAHPEYVVLDFNALVDNVSLASLANISGHVDNNHFITTINNGATPIGPQSNNVGVTIVEPYISTAKTVSPTAADINDPVTFTITYTSNGGNDSFLAVLTDTLPAAITVSSISASSIGGVVNLVNHHTTGSVVDVTADDMPVGSVITVMVMGTVNAATVGGGIVNTADATWSSLPGGVGTPVGANNTTGQVTPGADGTFNGARDGDTTASGGSANTYNSSGSVTLNIKTPAPVKSTISTSEASTSGNNVAIGEIVRYQLAVQMPEGVSPSFQIVDSLPAGLSFLGDTLVAFVSPSGANLTSSNSAINNLAGLRFTGTTANETPTALFPTDAAHLSGGTGDGVAVTFTFGNLTNTDTVGADTDFVVLQFNALVDNVTHNQTGTTDTNTFMDLVNDGAGPIQVGPTSNAVSVVIVQPSILNTTKTVTSTGRDPGDTVSYKATYTNTGNADAFDTLLVDNLPSTLILNPGSIVVKRNGITIATGFSNNSVGNMANVTVAQVAGTENTGTGDSMEIDYSATIKTTDAAGSTILNTANLTYTSLPGPFGTTSNPTGQSSPGGSGAANGERNGSGGINSYFGNSSQTITINSSTLIGFVYQDMNDNGVKDPGEPVIPNTTVTLTGKDFLGDPVDVVTTTNSSGQYTFSNLLPSNNSGYTITETQPANFLNGKETSPQKNFSGTIGLYSNVGSTIEFSDVYSDLVIGRESMLTGSNYNFGELMLTNVFPGPQIDPEETIRLFCNGSPTQISVNDPNSADLMQVTVSVTPGTGTLTVISTFGLTFTAGSNGTATMTFNGNVNAVNSALSRLSFMPAPYFSGSATLTITSQELNSIGNPVPGVTATNTVPMTITPINHPPTIVAPATQATHVNVPLVFSVSNGNAFTLGDPDVNPAVQVEQLTLTVTNGMLTLATMAGLTSVSGNGTASITLKGSINALNAAVNGLLFKPKLNTAGPVNLMVALNDLGNTAGPALQTSKVVAISVT